MRVRLVLTVSLAAALAGCGGQRVPAPDRHLPAAIATPPNDAALLRISRSGGSAALLRASTLLARQGSAVDGLPPIARMLGVNQEEETVYGADNGGRLVAIDLRSQRSRVVNTSARQFTTTPDGTILGVDSAHRPVRLIGHSVVTYKLPVERGALLFRAPAEQILVVGNRPGTLQVAGPAGEIRHMPIPDGRVTATWVGDLVAVTTDSGVHFIDPSGKPPARKAPPKFVKVKGTPTAAAFSPSGHRLYVALKAGGIATLNPYSRQQLKQPSLPVTADAFRADRSGRWLVAHATTGDSLWVIDVTRWAVVWTGTAPWADDLPLVVDGRMLLVRRKADLVAVDLAAEAPPDRGVLAGGGADLYVMLPWVPKAGSSSDVATSPPPAAGTPPALPGAQPAAPPATAPATPAAAAPGTNPPQPATSPTGTMYLQVSSSQSSEWAAALAKQLKDGGFPAKVLEPKTSDESYRVVVGPYASREDADAVGKRLGRPYFIITRGSGDT